MNPDVGVVGVPSLSLLPPVHAALAVNQVASLAAEAESLGFAGFWYADERFYRDTYAVLALCARATSTIRLGPAVTDPYTRHPAITAASVATLDEASAGRAVLGIGAGIGGFKNLGIQRRRPATTVREGIAIIRSLLSGATVTYEGQSVVLRDAKLAIPAREVPIYLAADGPMMLRLAGAVADGVIIYHAATRETLAPKLARVDDGVHQRGRTARPRVVARLDVCVSTDATAAVRRAKHRVARYLWARYPDKLGYLDAHGLRLPKSLRRHFDSVGEFPGSQKLEVYEGTARLIPDELVFPLTIAGTPSEVITRIRGLRQIGIDEVMVYPVPVENQGIVDAVRLVAGTSAGQGGEVGVGS